MNLLLGIDIGTTNCKACVYQENGTIISKQIINTKTHYSANGWSWYEAKELWATVVYLLNNLFKEIDSAKVLALAVTSIGEAGVPIDNNGEALYPIITWFDQRSLPQTKMIEELLGNEQVFAITGMDNNPIFSLTKILWLKENESNIFKKMVKWLNISDYISYKLTGNYVTSYSQASRTMVFDIKHNKWSEQIINTLGLKNSFFPSLQPSGKIIGKITAKAALETGLKPGMPVINGGHDHLCGSLASGILLGHRVLDSAGTAESISVILPKDHKISLTKYKGFRVGRYLNPDYIYIVGGIITSGVAVDWMKERVASLHDWPIKEGVKIKDISFELLIREVEKTRPGASGLLFLPHLRGSGAPYWDPKARGALLGLTASHNSPQIMRAVFEGLCFEAKIIIEKMQNLLSCPIEYITTIGGSTRNEFWQQLKADITGLTVEVTEAEEATALGAAMLAGVGIGLYQDMASASRKIYRVKKRFVPNPANNAKYLELYQLYNNLYLTVKNINDQLFYLSNS